MEVFSFELAMAMTFTIDVTVILGNYLGISSILNCFQPFSTVISALTSYVISLTLDFATFHKQFNNLTT